MRRAKGCQIPQLSFRKDRVATGEMYLRDRNAVCSLKLIFRELKGDVSRGRARSNASTHGEGKRDDDDDRLYAVYSPNKDQQDSVLRQAR